MLDFFSQKSDGNVLEFIIVGVFFLLLALSSGAVVLADSARPGDDLYMLDRAAESVQKAFTFDDDKKADLAVKFMEERQQELYSLIEDNANHDVLNEAYFEFESSMKVVFQNMDSTQTEGKLHGVMTRLEENSLKQEEKMQDAIHAASDNTKEVLKEAKETSSEGLKKAQESLSNELEAQDNNLETLQTEITQPETIETSQ